MFPETKPRIWLKSRLKIAQTSWIWLKSRLKIAQTLVETVQTVVLFVLVLLDANDYIYIVCHKRTRTLLYTECQKRKKVPQINQTCVKRITFYLTWLREALWICYLPVNKSNVHRLATLPGRQ